MSEQVLVATTPEDYDAFATLYREYQEWLHERYTTVPGLIDGVGSHQAMDEEIKALPQTYGPPAGKTLLALRHGAVVGCVSYRDLHDGTCEMKRLFVPERFQGKGTGRRLCRRLVDDATADGFTLMRLDTGSLQHEAMSMYESMGFRRCPPYHHYPDELMAHLRFMELPLHLPPGA